MVHGYMEGKRGRKRRSHCRLNSHAKYRTAQPTRSRKPHLNGTLAWSGGRLTVAFLNTDGKYDNYEQEDRVVTHRVTRMLLAGCKQPVHFGLLWHLPRPSCRSGKRAGDGSDEAGRLDQRDFERTWVFGKGSKLRRFSARLSKRDRLILW